MRRSAPCDFRYQFGDHFGIHCGSLRSTVRRSAAIPKYPEIKLPASKRNRGAVEQENIHPKDVHGGILECQLDVESNYCDWAVPASLWS